MGGKDDNKCEGDDRNLQDSGNDPPERCPAKPCCNRRQQAHSRQRHLQDGSPVIARGKFSRSYFSSAFHSGRMFDEADVDGSTREQPTCQRGNEFGKLTHRFFLPTTSQLNFSLADALQEKRKLAKSTDCVGGANVL